MLKEILEKYSEKIQIKKGDFLYTPESNDSNLYYILSGEFILLAGNKLIAVVGKDELSGEKSFLNNTTKPISAKASQDSELLVLKQETFQNLSDREKFEITKAITLFVSDRVYRLNDIINNISNISKKLLNFPSNLNLDYFKVLFFEIINLDNFFAYKNLNNSLIPLFESTFKPDMLELAQNLISEQNKLIIKNKEIILKIENYIFILEGEIKANTYILQNTLIHSLASLKYLGEKIEQIKNSKEEEFLNCELD